MVSRHLGFDGGYQGVIPPYVVLTRSHGRFSEEGFLGTRYKPFATGGDPSKDPFLVEGILQGLLGATLGLTSLFGLFYWIKMKFSGPGILNIFEFSFFEPPIIVMIAIVSILLCLTGSYSSMRKYLRS